MADLNTMMGGLRAQMSNLLGAPPKTPAPSAPEPAPTADPYADTEAIVSLVTKFRDEFGKKEIREQFVRTSYRNILFSKGVQWIRWTGAAGGARWRPANVPKGVPTPVTNRFASTMDAVISVFGRIEPQLNFRPGSPDEPQDRAAADVSIRAIQVIEDEVDVRIQRQYLANWVGYTGGGFLETGYDPDPVHGMLTIPVDACPGCSQTQPQGAPMCESCGQLGPLTPQTIQVPRGKMYADVVPLFEAFFDPSIPHWQRHKRFLREKAVSVEEAKERWPDIAEQISANIAGTADEHYMTALATQGAPLDERSTGRRDHATAPLLNNRCTERWYWQMPNATYPDGLLAIVVGAKALAYAKPLPYWAQNADGEKQRFLPFVWFPQKLVPGTFLPKTVADDLALKQMQRNRWESAIELCGMRMGMPIWLRPRGAAVAGLTQGGGEAGAVLDYNALGPGAAKPERIPGQPLPMSFIEMLQIIDKDFEELAACVVGETRIPCLDGITRTAAELARDYPDGGMWVYGFDCETRRVVPSLIERAWKTGAKPCLRLEFEEGTAVECSFDHPFLTWDRGYVEAQHLQPGDSLIPFEVFQSSKGYMQVLQPVRGRRGGKRCEPVHRMVARSMLGLSSADRRHVHHRDGSKINNLPENLEILTGQDHAAQHRDEISAAVRAYWDGLTSEEKSNRNREVWAQTSPEARREHVRAALEARTKMTPEERQAKGRLQSERMRAYWASRTPEERAEQHRKMRPNHKVACIVDIGGREVYDLTTTTHNFALDAGIYAHNTFDVIKGARPEGVSAGIALQILQERGMSRYGPLFILWETAWAEWARQALEIFRQFATEERLLKIQGADGRWQVQKFIGADLQGRIDVVAEAGSSMPRSSLLDRAEMEQMAALGLINFRDPETQYKGLEIYGRTNMLPSMQLDTKNAIMENEVFEQIAQMPIWRQATPQDVAAVQEAPDYPSVLALLSTWEQSRGMGPIPWPKVWPGLDNHAIMSREHGKYGKSETFRSQFPEIVQAIFEKHKSYHDQLSIQQAAALQGGGQIQGGFLQPAPGGAMPPAAHPGPAMQQPMNTSSSGMRMAGDFAEMGDQQLGGGA